MKASVLLSVMLIAGISCVSEQTGIHTDGKTARFCVSVDSGSATRASSAGSENALNRIQFVLFRDGILYSSASSDGNSTDMEADFGTYSLYAFVNDPTEWISMPDLTEEKIMSSASSFSDNSLSSYVMFGYVPSFEIDERFTSITVNVDRLASRIMVGNLKVDFSSNSHYKGCSLKIRNMYLTNVLGKCPYSMIPSGSPSSSDRWYNRMGLEDSGQAIMSMTADKGLDIVIQDGSSTDLDKVYYAYPNGCVSDSDSGQWESRRTRLVIEATLDGKECWYHITLPPMKSNASYSIESCTIMNIGGISPEDNTIPSCEVIITESLSWDQTFSVEEES